MNTQKFLISGIAGGIVAFLGGWLIYGILLMDFMMANAGTATNVMRADMDMIWWALIVGNIFFGLILSYVYNKWANISSLAAGLTAGATIGFFVIAGFDLVMYATSNVMSLKGTLVDIAAGTVLWALTGAAVGWTNGMGKKA